jgi:hypothetical protein
MIHACQEDEQHSASLASDAPTLVLDPQQQQHGQQRAGSAAGGRGRKAGRKEKHRGRPLREVLDEMMLVHADAESKLSKLQQEHEVSLGCTRVGACAAARVLVPGASAVSVRYPAVL